MVLKALVALAAFAMGSAFAAAVPPQVAQSSVFRDDVSMADYLATLNRISPQVREAADLYSEGYKAKCGRPISTVRLRRAFAEGNGDPILMGMFRAVYFKDESAKQSLQTAVECDR